MYIDAGDAETNMALFDALHANKALIESSYGGPLEWEPIEGKRACRIADYGEGSVENTDQHDAYIDWLFDRGVRLRQAIAAYLTAAASDLGATS